MSSNRFLFSLIAFVLLSTVVLASNLEEHEGLESAKFSYSGSNGPSQWGSLSESYSTCSTGKIQSPVNIVKEEIFLNETLGSLTRDYKPANATLVNWGFNLGVQYEEDAGGLLIDGKRYNLKQMHWHTPSEHLIGGQRFPVELHMVHKAEDHSVAVVGILFQYGLPDPILSKMNKSLDKLAHDMFSNNEQAHIPLAIFDTKQIKQDTRTYYRYIGSLTTPPCTENVTWTVLGKVRTISKEQVEALKGPLKTEYKNNSRPVQPLNGRKIELFNELAPHQNNN